jgi:hypothetical protein
MSLEICIHSCHCSKGETTLGKTLGTIFKFAVRNGMAVAFSPFCLPAMDLNANPAQVRECFLAPDVINRRAAYSKIGVGGREHTMFNGATTKRRSCKGGKLELNI